jgi:hypothetical protein
MQRYNIYITLSLASYFLYHPIMTDGMPTVPWFDVSGDLLGGSVGSH